MFEIIGIIASIAIFMNSFADIKKCSAINDIIGIAGCLMYFVYGISINSFSLILLYSTLCFINVYNLSLRSLNDGK